MSNKTSMRFSGPLSVLPHLRSRTSITRHATWRKQQRAISTPMIDLVQDWGVARHCGGGCEKYYFNKYSWERFARAETKAAKRYSKLRNIYVVIGSNGALVTAAHRTKRIKKDI
jgi:hypothetical protein